MALLKFYVGIIFLSWCTHGNGATQYDMELKEKVAGKNRIVDVGGDKWLSEHVN